MHGWTDGFFLGWHCVMLITYYVNIAFIGWANPIICNINGVEKNALVSYHFTWEEVLVLPPVEWSELHDWCPLQSGEWMYGWRHSTTFLPVLATPGSCFPYWGSIPTLYTAQPCCVFKYFMNRLVYPLRLHNLRFIVSMREQRIWNCLYQKVPMSFIDLEGYQSKPRFLIDVIGPHDTSKKCILGVLIYSGMGTMNYIFKAPTDFPYLK